MAKIEKILIGFILCVPIVLTTVLAFAHVQPSRFGDTPTSYQEPL